jgi:hypothetical protein
MRHTALFAILSAFSMSAPAVAQEWQQFDGTADFFSANFPSPPAVEQITWESEYGARVPARRYVARQGANTYSVTVVDYNLVKNRLMENGKKCPQGDERCDGLTAFSGLGYWKQDLRGALVYASFRLMRPDNVKVTYYQWTTGGAGLDTHELQLLNTRDQTRTFATIIMHNNLLYVMEGATPVSAPIPNIFTQSLSLLERDGMRIAHGRVMINACEIDSHEITAGLDGRR